MYANFTEEYKRLMIETENAVKASGWSEILPEDVFLRALEIKTGPIHELFADCGVNTKIANEVLAKPPFNRSNAGRT